MAENSITVHSDAFVPFFEGEYDLIQDELKYNGYQYSKRRNAFEGRAQNLFRFDKYEWLKMAEFFEFKCIRCGCDVIGGMPTKDHIISITMGGTNSIRNLQPLCRQCNVITGHESIDYRLLWCENEGIKLPEKWRLIYG